MAWLVLGGGVGLYVCLMYPGAFFTDTIGLYRQAISHQYAEWHSPLLAAIWGVLDRRLPGFASLLAFGATTATVGLYLIFRAADVSPLRSALGATAMLFAPPVFTSLFWLGKDPAALGTLLLGAGVLLHGEPRWPWGHARFGLGLLLLTLPCMVRTDYGPLAALVVGGTLFARPEVFPRRRPRRRAALALAVVGLFFVVNLGLDEVVKFRVLRARRMFVLQSVLNHDLAAISLYEGRVIAPAFLRRQGWDLEYVRTYYSPRKQDPLTWPPGRPDLVFSPDPADHREIVRLWLGAVSAHPIVYLQHRAAVFAYLLALTPAPRDLVPSVEWLIETSTATCATEASVQHLPKSDCVFHGPAVLRAVLAVDAALYAAVPALFHPLTYAALCLVGLALAVWRARSGERSGRTVVHFGVSAVPLAHLGLLFFCAPSTDWRYLCLLIVGGVCCAGFVVAAVANEAARRRRVVGPGAGA